MNNLEILKKISEYKHYSYGSKLSFELIKVFRIKNLLLFAFKLLQKYEQVTQSACSQIKKNVLLNQLHLAELEIRRLDVHINYWINNKKNIENIVKELREKFTSISKFSLPSGESKIDTFCKMSDFFDDDIFVNCDDIFYKKVNNTKLSEAQFVLFPQKLPFEYYKDLIYLQMHFNLLLVQGFNFALPLLTTKFSFLNRIIYWPHRPRFGFLDKSKDLNNKLSAIKIHIVVCLKELINAISEVEKWIYFCINSYDLFNTYMKAICVRKKDLFQKLHKLKFQYKHFNLEHNRLVGAIAKSDVTFFERHPYLLILNSAAETSITSPEQTPAESLSAFSKNSNENVEIKEFNLPIKTKTEREDSLVGTKSDLYNFNFLPSLYQSEKSKLSSDTKISKKNNLIKSKKIKSDKEFLLQPIFKPIKHKAYYESKPSKSILFNIPVSETINEPSIIVPKSTNSIPRLENILSSPLEKLYCNCLLTRPSTEEIKKCFSDEEDKSINQNNDTFVNLFNYLNNNNFIEPKYTSMRNKMNDCVNNFKLEPQLKKIKNDMNENILFLRTISHEDELESKKLHFEETFNDRVMILNMISSTLNNDNGNHSKNQNQQYYGILNSFLSSCGYQGMSNCFSEQIPSSSNNFKTDILQSLELEHSMLHKSYLVNAVNKDENDSPIIYNEETKLMESLKLYSKYAF